MDRHSLFISKRRQSGGLGTGSKIAATPFCIFFFLSTADTSHFRPHGMAFSDDLRMGVGGIATEARLRLIYLVNCLLMDVLDRWGYSSRNQLMNYLQLLLMHDVIISSRGTASCLPATSRCPVRCQTSWGPGPPFLQRIRVRTHSCCGARSISLTSCNRPSKVCATHFVAPQHNFIPPTLRHACMGGSVLLVQDRSELRACTPHVKSACLSLALASIYVCANLGLRAQIRGAS